MFCEVKFFSSYIRNIYGAPYIPQISLNLEGHKGQKLNLQMKKILKDAFALHNA